MKVGELVYDYALRRNGIVVSGSWIEQQGDMVHPIQWEWLVLYNDGNLMGADTNDLNEITAATAACSSNCRGMHFECKCGTI